MDNYQFITLFVTCLGGFGFLVKMIKEETAELKSENAAQARRTDKLYEMFIDLIKSE